MTSLSGLLDIAIVLTGVYTALSCLVSWLNERVAEVLSLRGETLYVGILNLVMGELPLVRGIFEHPLVTAARNDKNGKPDLSKPYRPSYLDARNFSVALWECVHAGKATPAPTSAADLVQTPQTVVSLVQTPQTIISELAKCVDTLDNAELKKALSPLIEQAGEDYQKLLATTDGWFNAQMDRVSGWYRRRAQYCVMAISAIIVLLSGLDSVEIATRLSADPQTRAKIAADIAAGVGQPAGQTAVAKTLDAEAQTNLTSFVHLPWNGAQWQHVPGMVVTLLALTLGGPFWFDLLSSLINVRGAGRKPKRKDQPPQ